MSKPDTIKDEKDFSHNTVNALGRKCKKERVTAKEHKKNELRSVL